MTATLDSATVAEFLRHVPLCAELSFGMCSEIAARSTEVTLPAGSWLFHEGDPADAMYVLYSGRLDVVFENVGVPVRALASGAVLGELALLTESARSASVRARRTSRLIRIARSDFSALLSSGAELALAMTRHLGAQLRMSRPAASVKPAAPVTIALVPFEPAVDVERVAEALAARLPAERLDHDVSYEQRVDAAEQHGRQLLLVCHRPPGQDAWTDFCLAQADRVVGIVAGGELPEAEVPTGCDLALVGDGIPRERVARWCARTEARRRYSISNALDGIDRAARRLACRSLGVVLGGGGARAMAHLGVLAELEDAGFVIDRVGGCSMGGMVGALYATGIDAAELYRRFRELFIGGDYYSNIFEDYGPRAAELRVRLYGESIIEELPREYYCVSADLVGGGLVIHRDGLVADAVGASTALPGLAPPLAVDGRLLVDGGVLDNLPVEAMAEDGDGPIVAVDVAARRDRVARWASRLADSGGEVSAADLLMQAFDLGSVHSGAAARRRADVFIAPDISAGMLQYHKMDQIVEAGRTATRGALADINALMS